MRKGWFVLKDQTGERSVDEQLLGLEDVVSEISGKSVLDLGCAEGAILFHMKQHGAGRCLGYEGNLEHFDAAKKLLANTGCEVEWRDLNNDHGFALEWDVVLLLAILHKLHDPEKGLRQFVEACRDLLVIRLPIGSEGAFKSKHRKAWVDTRAVLTDLGFNLLKDADGPRGERVHIWRRA